MRKLSIEAKVGVFVIMGIMILAYMSMRIGRFKYGPDRGLILPKALSKGCRWK